MRENGRVNNIEPRYRNGEQIPMAFPGETIVRFDKELVRVPARNAEDLLVGESGYTQRQVDTLTSIGITKLEDQHAQESEELIAKREALILEGEFRLSDLHMLTYNAAGVRFFGIYPDPS